MDSRPKYHAPPCRIWSRLLHASGQFSYEPLSLWQWMTVNMTQLADLIINVLPQSYLRDSVFFYMTITFESIYFGLSVSFRFTLELTIFVTSCSLQMMYPTFIIFLVHTQHSFIDSYGSISASSHREHGEESRPATAEHLSFASPPTTTQGNSESLAGDTTSIGVLDQVSTNAEIHEKSTHRPRVKRRLLSIILVRYFDRQSRHIFFSPGVAFFCVNIFELNPDARRTLPARIHTTDSRPPEPKFWM